MTIKEVEKQTELARSNIRYYEKEKLIEPSRNEKNGYRDYSQKDVEDIKKIAYLRTLGISIEDIRSVISEKITLHEAVKKQNKMLENQITDLHKAKVMCQKILDDRIISYEEFKIEEYVEELQDYWKENQPVFKLDAVSFFYIWGSFITWGAITVLCLIIGILSYAKLPPEIPVQWSDGAASSLVDRKLIFTYPIACIVIRYLLRPFISVKLQMYHHYGEMLTEYLSNYLCFLALSAEAFTILFVYGVVRNIVIVLVVDTVVLIGVMLVGIVKLNAEATLQSGLPPTDTP